MGLVEQRIGDGELDHKTRPPSWDDRWLPQDAPAGRSRARGSPRAPALAPPPAPAPGPAAAPATAPAAAPALAFAASPAALPSVPLDARSVFSGGGGAHHAVSCDQPLDPAPKKRPRAWVEASGGRGGEAQCSQAKVAALRLEIERLRPENEELRR